MFRVYKMMGQARDMGVSIKRSSTSKELKRRVLEVDCICWGWRGCSGLLIIEVERRVYELKCWEIRTLQISV